MALIGFVNARRFLLSQRSVFLRADFDRLQFTDVNFGDLLRLNGYRVGRDPAGVTLQLHWQALSKIRTPLRCFAHVLAAGEQISCLDHDILDGYPDLSHWDPEDRGYENLRLWLRNPPENLRVRLGVYNPEINVRVPVLASTLPVQDESTAVLVEPDQPPSSSYQVQFSDAVLHHCRVVFDGGIELAGYSVDRCRDLVLLRLRWMVRRGSRRVVRFFGHVVEQPDASSAALSQFDQDLLVHRVGPITTVEQNIIRSLPHGEPAWLRAGVAER